MGLKVLLTLTIHFVLTKAVPSVTRKPVHVAPSYYQNWTGIVTHLPEYKYWCGNYVCQLLLLSIKLEPHRFDLANKPDYETWRDCMKSLHKLEDTIMGFHSLERNDVHFTLTQWDFCDSGVTRVINRTKENYTNSESQSTAKTARHADINRCRNCVEHSYNSVNESGLSEFWLLATLLLSVLLLVLLAYKLCKCLSSHKVDLTNNNIVLETPHFSVLDPSQIV